VLIGGGGADTLAPWEHGDGSLYIGGTTIYDRTAAALTAIQAEWGRTDGGSNYQGRVDNLAAGTGLAAGYKLDATTVFNDRIKDTLVGYVGGWDWFFSSAGDIVTNDDGEYRVVV